MINYLSRKVVTAGVRNSGIVGFDDKEGCQVWEEFKAGDRKAHVYVFRQHSQELLKNEINVCLKKDLTKDCVRDIYKILPRAKCKIFNFHNLKSLSSVHSILISCNPKPKMFVLWLM
jgi:hypothetical protein